MPQNDLPKRTRTKSNRARATRQYVDLTLQSGNVIRQETGCFSADKVEPQLGNVLERVSDAVVALDKNWRYTYVNQRAAALFGRRPEDLIGKHIWTEFPEGRGQPFHVAYERAMAEQVSIQMESYYEPWNRWFENRIYPSPHGLSIFFQEITERKRAEHAEHQSAELLKGQNEVLQLIARGAPLEESLDLLLRVIEAQSPGMLCSILLLDSAGLHLRHAAAPSLPKSFTHALDGKPIGAWAGSCGTAAFRGEPVIVEDIGTDSLWQDYRHVALKHGFRSCWSTPIFDEQRRVLGTFALYFCDPGRPTEWHRELIDIATSTAAISIVRHRRMETLRASEERFRLAATGGNVGIWEWDVGTDRLVCSDELKAIFGRPQELNSNLTLRMFMDEIHREDRLRVERELQRCLAERANYEVEFRILLPDGSPRWIAAKARAEYDATGTPLRMLGIGLDITGRKRVEQEINRREAQLLMAQRIAHLGSYEWDVSTNCVYRSDELCRIFGVHPDQFEPTYEGYVKRIHPEDREITRRTIEQAFRDGEPFDFEERIIRPDGEMRVLHSQGQWVSEKGTPVKLVGICQDITERKQAEQQVRTANAALSAELKERIRAEKEICALSARLISAQEEERTRLARELHDDVSQQIAAVSIAMSNLKKEIPVEYAGLGDQSGRIQTRLVHVAQSIRRLSHDLHPAVLQHSGLSAGLRSYCAEFGSLTGIRVSFTMDNSVHDVPSDVALCFYRVAQEALQNVLKHAKVTRASVALECSAGILCLTVSDPGVGIDLDQTQTSPGLGLISIRERARLVNGTIEIETQPNLGTRLKLKVPV